MKAMILAAGLGRRMGVLTQELPKPLLSIEGRPLIDYHLQALAAAGVTEVVINLHHLGERIQQFVGTGEHWDIRVTYSHEEQLLETGGGILQALPLLGNEPFWLVNGDIATDFDFSQFRRETENHAHLVLVDNPPHHPQGDFVLASDGQVGLAGGQRYTYSGIALLRAELFAHKQPGAFALGTLLKEQVKLGLVSGERYQGRWSDIGTPERLQQQRRTSSYR